MIYNATSSAPGVVELNLIDPNDPDATTHPSIVVADRNGTWGVTKGLAAGLVWRGPYLSVAE